jgi:hypothetical protein
VVILFPPWVYVVLNVEFVIVVIASGLLNNIVGILLEAL